MPREKRYRVTQKDDGLGPFRWKWVQVARQSIIIYLGRGEMLAEAQRANPELGNDEFVRINFRPPLSTWNLGAYTEAELLAVKEMFDAAFAAAQPICREYDRLARERYEGGDSDFARLYRQVPSVATRRSGKRSHRPGLPIGPDGLPEVDGERTDAADDLGGDGEVRGDLPDESLFDLEAPYHAAEAERPSDLG